MVVRKLDHVGIVVDDLTAAIEFFTAIGLERSGDGSVEGKWVDNIVGLEGMRSDIVFMRAPHGESQLELVKVKSPAFEGDAGRQPSNAPGIRHLAFQVEDLDTTLARLSEHGAELVGTVERYGNTYRLCYVWGPTGIIVELAQRLNATR